MASRDLQLHPCDTDLENTSTRSHISGNRSYDSNRVRFLSFENYIVSKYMHLKPRIQNFAFLSPENATDM